ncbi:hypothetical protein [Desulfatibacillum aliphaticivorans]|uniref:hypothetical protein n=1 Tax=Desulfatibacillum aliphaticivorans TaxID=218208 RepID=UPI0003F9B6FF|nr:hypothetical protein [Desulfatibacillum aliphaticivorans]
MKSLLTAVQTALKAGLTDVRDRDIFIAPFELYLPEAAKSPAIGIKDHGSRRRELSGNMVEVARAVMVIPWVRVIDPEKAVMGSGGVLALSGLIQALLDENRLSLANCIDGFCPNDSPSEMAFTKTAQWQRQELIFTYTFEEERP